jgi:hypothetical protein
MGTTKSSQSVEKVLQELPETQDLSANGHFESFSMVSEISAAETL